MANVQANLKIRLFADEVVVAESQDHDLWQRVLADILAGGDEVNPGAKVKDPAISPKGATRRGEGPKDSNGALGRFAKLVDVPLAELKGAVGPEKEKPFLHLDARTWEAFKQNFPIRGPGAVAAVVFAATALVIWLDLIGEEAPTTAQCQAVLGTINITGKNPSRSIKNCEWLQERNGRIQLNPARVSQAYSVIKAFCLRQGLAGSS